MAIIDKTDDFYIYKYEVNELYLLFPSEEYKVPAERVNGITLIEDFVQNLYPIFKIDLGIEQSTYNKIIENKENMQVKLSLRKYYRKNTEKEKSMKSNYINGVFTLILDDTVNTIEKNAHETEFPDGDTDQITASTISYEVFLFRGQTIKNNTAMINNVFQNCTVSAAIAWMFTKLGMKNILMSRASNQKSYPEFVIPPLRTADAFAFIDAYYGIFDTGSIIYFGLDRNYVIPFCKASNALEDGEPEIVTIIVPTVGSRITDNICTVKKQSDPDRPYLIADPNSFSPATRDTSASIIEAPKVEVVNNKEGSVQGSSDKNRKSKVKVSLNDMYQSIYSAITTSNSVVISLNFKDADFSILTPNKKYQFIFEDTSLTQTYKGTYHLASISFTFVKESKDLTGEAQAIFRKAVK